MHVRARNNLPRTPMPIRTGTVNREFKWRLPFPGFSAQEYFRMCRRHHPVTHRQHGSIWYSRKRCFSPASAPIFCAIALFTSKMRSAFVSIETLRRLARYIQRVEESQQKYIVASPSLPLRFAEQKNGGMAHSPSPPLSDKFLF